MKSIIFAALFLLALLLISKYFFDPTNLYFELPWLDIPMHIVGGAGIAFLFIAVQKYRRKTTSLKRLLVWYFAIAIGWELFEIIKDTTRSLPLNPLPDTVSDIFNGWIGMYIGYFISKKK